MLKISDGYAFKSRLPSNALRARLSALGHGDWQERESGVYGDYITGTLWGVRMRIFDGQGTTSEVGTYDPHGFMLLDYARGEHPTAAQDARIRAELLPSLAVTEWRPDERND